MLLTPMPPTVDRLAPPLSWWLVLAFLWIAVLPGFCQETRVLRIWAIGEEGEKLPELVRRFEAAHPGVRIEHQTIPWQAAHERLLTAVVGGMAPDVAQVGTTWMAELHAMQALHSLGPAATHPLKDHFFPGAWETVVLDGQVYGLPWYVETRCLFYRTDRGVTPPTTWHEWSDFGRRMQGAGGRYGFILPLRDDQGFLPFVWQNQADPLHPERPEFIEALKFYAGFFKEGLTPSAEGAEMDLLYSFESGALPAFVSGPWMISIIDQQKPALKDRWSVAELPAGKVKASWMGGSNLVVFNGSRQPQLAAQFVAFCAQPEIQVVWFETLRDLPAAKTAWDHPALQADPRVATFGRTLPYARPAATLPEWERIADAIKRRQEEAGRGSLSAEEAARRLAVDLQRILPSRQPAQGNAYRMAILTCVALAMLAALIAFLAPSDGTAGKRGWGWTPWLFLAPALGLLAVFLFLPLGASLLISLTDWNIYGIATFDKVRVVGIENYRNVLQDRLFWKALSNTLWFACIGGPLCIVVSLLVAILVDGLAWGKSFVRTGLFLPVVTSLVAVATVWRWIYHPTEAGLANAMLGTTLPWLTDPRLALPSLIAMALWKNFGYNMVIFMAGLQGISRTYYEAASLDGASGWQSFWHVTLPQLRPALVFVTLLTTIGYLQFFAEPYVMTQGGPEDATLSIVLYLYRKGFQFYELGAAAAMSYVLFFVTLIFSAVQLKMSRVND